MKSKPVNKLGIQPKDDERVKQLNSLLISSAAVLAIIEEVAPKLNTLVEENISIVTENFSKIATTSKALARFFELSGTDVKPMIDEMSHCISNALIGIQFQDRLSQNLVILKNISEQLNKGIKDAINLQQVNNDSWSRALNLDLIKKIFEDLKLGEVRQVYINFLLQNGLIKSPSELGFVEVPAEEKNQHNDDVELF